MNKIKFAFCVLLTAVLVYQPAYGGENDNSDTPWERFSFRAGGLLATLDGNIRIGSGLGVGVDIDVEDVLGLSDDVTNFRLDAMYRFGGHRRHRADLTYYQFRRTAFKSLQREIEIGDEVFPVGTTIDTLLDIQIIRASYAYSLFRDNRFDIAIGGGFYIAPLEVSVTNTVTGRAGGEKVTAPLPTVNLRFDFALSEKWFVRQHIDFFYLEIDQFKGGITDITAVIEYNPWKHIGFGAGFDFFRIFIEGEDEDVPGVDLNGNIKLNWNSLMLYARYYFK